MGFNERVTSATLHRLAISIAILPAHHYDAESIRQRERERERERRLALSSFPDSMYTSRMRFSSDSYVVRKGTCRHRTGRAGIDQVYSGLPRLVPARPGLLRLVPACLDEPGRAGISGDKTNDRPTAQRQSRQPGRAGASRSKPEQDVTSRDELGQPVPARSVLCLHVP